MIVLDPRDLPFPTVNFYNPHALSAHVTVTWPGHRHTTVTVGPRSTASVPLPTRLGPAHIHVDAGVHVLTLDRPRTRTRPARWVTHKPRRLGPTFND